MKDKFDDRLAEPEAVIIQYYLDKGYKLYKDQKDGDVEWSFDIQIDSSYKNKNITVVFRNYENFVAETFITKGHKTIKEMFNAAIERFSKTVV